MPSEFDSTKVMVTGFLMDLMSAESRESILVQVSTNSSD